MKSSPRLYQVHRRPFGIGPVPLLGGLGAVVLLVAIVLFAVGSWIVALFLLAAAVGLTALLLVALRARLKPLGEAVHRDDQDRAEVLKAQASDLSEALHAADAQDRPGQSWQTGSRGSNSPRSLASSTSLWSSSNAAPSSPKGPSRCCSRRASSTP